MDLVSRYLQAVRFWLPKGRQNDIVAELSDDLHAQIEDHEEALGRALNEDEIEEIVQRCGHPIVVAERFQSHWQRGLIGPELFAVYRMLLRGFWLYYMLPWLAVWIVFACTPGYRAEHPGIELLVSLGPWWHLAVNSFAILTLGFAVLDRLQPKLRWFETWSPRTLPPPADPNRIPRANSFSEMMIDVASVVTWIILPHGADIHAHDPSGAAWYAGPVWHTLHDTFFWPILALASAGAVVSTLNLFKPYWTQRRLLVRATVMALSTAVTAAISAMHWSRVHEQWNALATARTISVEFRTSMWTDWTVFACVVCSAGICLFLALYHGFKALRWRPSPGDVMAQEPTGPQPA